MNQPQPSSHPSNPRMALFAGAASVATVAILILIKLLAYIENGSASVLASLIDSLVDAGGALVTFMAIRVSLMPADAEHRYGHGKAEGLAALFQAGFMAGAGAFLFLESVTHFNAHTANGGEHFAIIVMGVSIVLSLALVGVQKYSLRYAPSLAVEADKAHYSADIIINAGVIAILLGLNMGLPHWADPVFALAVALYLGWTVVQIAGQGLDMLLDRELPDSTRELIIQKTLAHPGVLGMHDLRTRKSGMRIFMSFDIELDPSLLLYTAHDIVRQVEHEILIDFPNAEILIHADPHGDTYDTRHNVEGVHRD